MKKWNWTIFVVILCTAEIGTLSNTSMTLPDALLIGLIIGIPLGMLAAYFTRWPES